MCSLWEKHGAKCFCGGKRDPNVAKPRNFRLMQANLTPVFDVFLIFCSCNEWILLPKPPLNANSVISSCGEIYYTGTDPKQAISPIYRSRWPKTFYRSSMISRNHRLSDIFEGRKQNPSYLWCCAR